MSAKVQAHIALFTVALIYGLNYSIAKDVMPAFVEARGFILLRAIGATSLFWFTSSLMVTEKVKLSHHLRLAACGLFGVATNQILFFEGLSITSPINAAVMMTVNPILVLLMSVLILRESLRLSRILGIFLGIGGALYLISRGGTLSDILDADKSLGNLLVFLNAASYAAYLVIVKPLMAEYRAITVIKWVFFYGLIMVLPLGFQQFQNVEWHALPTDIIWKMAFVVIGTTYLAYLLNVYALKTVSSTTVSFYIYLQPLIAAISAIILGKDSLSAILLISAAMIFSGVFLVSFFRK